MKIIRFIKKRWFLLVILTVLVLFSYQKLISEPAKKEKTETYKVKKRDLTELLSLAGEIDAEEKVTLRFQASGRLAWVGVKEGDYVKKYQTIASLDQRSLRKTLEKNLRDYSKERNDFEEDKLVTYPNGALTDTIKRILEKNQWDLEKAVLDVELQSITIEYANLWSPIEGIVTRVDAPFAGVNITPAQAEFEIVNPNTIYFLATADQADVIPLKNDMVGKINFDAYPDETYNGNLYYISFTPKQNETGTVYELRFKLDEQASALSLKLGMTGDMDILIKELKNVLSVPTLFIKKDNKGEYVKLKERGIFVKKYIQTGEEIDGKITIKTGLSEGELIYD